MINPSRSSNDNIDYNFRDNSDYSHSGYIEQDGFLIPSDVELPDYYESMVSSEDKINMALDIADKVESKYGINVITSSIAGSRLRGMDHADSDSYLVALTDKKMSKSKCVKIDGDDVQIHYYGDFADKLSTSVPFVEFLHSPFRVTKPEFVSYLNSLQVNKYILNQHAQGFVHHMLQRSKLDEGKAARGFLTTYWVSQNMTPICPRKFFDGSGMNDEMEAWLLDAAPKEGSKSFERFNRIYDLLKKRKSQ